MRARSLVRRCAALALMLCLGLFWSVEVAIADVHDGDATEVPAEHGAPTVQPDTPYTVATASAAHTDAPESHGSHPVEHHSAHVDHCAHGHVAHISAGSSAPESAPIHGVVPDSSASAPASLRHAPPVPPPVA